MGERSQWALRRSDETFDQECYRMTGHYPEWYGDLFRSERTKGLNAARGGLPRGSYLAKYAIGHYGAVIVSIEPVARQLPPLVDWEVFALMWANDDSQAEGILGSVSFRGKLMTSRD